MKNTKKGTKSKKKSVPSKKSKAVKKTVADEFGGIEIREIKEFLTEVHGWPATDPYHGCGTGFCTTSGC